MKEKMDTEYDIDGTTCTNYEKIVLHTVIIFITCSETHQCSA